MTANTFDPMIVASPLSGLILAGVCYSLKAGYRRWRSRTETKTASIRDEKVKIIDVRDLSLMDEKNLTSVEPHEAKEQPKSNFFPQLWRKTAEEDLEKGLAKLTLTKPEVVLIKKPVLKSFSKRATSGYYDGTYIDPSLLQFSWEDTAPEFNYPSPIQDPRTFDSELEDDLTTAIPIVETTFACNIQDCSSIFSARGDLIDHYAKAHDRGFPCDICEPVQAFRLKADLTRHKRSLHREEHDEGWYCEVEGCDISSKKWPRKDNRDRHMRNVHKKGQSS